MMERSLHPVTASVEMPHCSLVSDSTDPSAEILRVGADFKRMFRSFPNEPEYKFKIMPERSPDLQLPPGLVVCTCQIPSNCFTSVTSVEVCQERSRRATTASSGLSFKHIFAVSIC